MRPIAYLLPLLLTTSAFAQNTYSWTAGTAGTGASWFAGSGSNWNPVGGAPAGTWPGSGSNTGNTDIALFNSATANNTISVSFDALGASNLYLRGIRMGTNSRPITIGAIGNAGGSVWLAGDPTTGVILENLNTTNTLTLQPTNLSPAILRLSLYGGDNVVNAVGNITITARVLEGTTPAFLTKTGGGTLTLAANNAYTGGTTVNAGTLVVGHANALGLDTANLIVNSTLNLNGFSLSKGALGGVGTIANTAASPVTLSVGNDNGSGVYAGTFDNVNLTKAGTGTQTLTADHANPIAVTVSGGTLVVGGNLTNPASTIAVTSGATLRLDRSTDSEYRGQWTGSGAIQKLGAGTLTLGDTVNPGTPFTGTLSVQAGDVRLGNGTYAGNTAGTVALAAGTSLVVQNPTTGGPYPVSAAVSGAGDVEFRSGANTVSGNSSFTGAVSITAGSVRLLHANALGAGTGNLTVHGTLDLNGQAVTKATWSGSGALSSASASSLTFGGSNADTTFSGSVGSNVALVKNGTGTHTLSGTAGATATFRVNAGTLAAGSATAFGTASTNTIRFGGGTLRLFDATDLSSRFSTAASQPYRIDTNDQAVTFGTALASSGGSLTKLGSGTLAVTENSPLTGGIAVQAGTLQLGSGALAFNSQSNVAVSAGATLAIANWIGSQNSTILGAGNVVVAGANVFLNATNSYTGSTTIDAGASITVEPGTFGSSSGTLTVNGQLVIANGNLTKSTLSGGGTIVGSNEFTASQFTVTESATSTFAGRFDLHVPGSGGGRIEFFKRGTGTLILTGDNRLNQVTISQGTLQLGDGGTTGGIDAPIAVSGTLTLQRINDFTLGDAITGSGQVRKLGANTVTATNLSTTVTAVVAEGVLSTAALPIVRFDGGTFRYTGGALTTTGNLAISPDRTATLDVAAGSRLVLSTSIPGTTGGFQKAGAGELRFTGNHAWTGVTTLAGGTMEVAALTNGGTAGPLGAASADPANLIFAGGTLHYTGGTSAVDRGFTATSNALINVSTATSTLTIGGTVVGSGGVTKLGSGTLELTGDNTYGGPTSVSAGTLRVGHANALGAASGSLALSSSTLDLRGFSVAKGPLTGGGNVTNTATAAATLTTDVPTGNSSFIGVLAQSGGPLGLTKTGAGTLTLAVSSSTYDGPTTVRGGRLTINSNNANANGAVTVESGATLSGSGTVGGTVSVLEGGAINLSGVLDLNQSLFLSPGARFEVDLVGGSGAKFVELNGSLSIDEAVLALTVTGTFAANSKAHIAINNGSNSVVGRFQGLPQGAQFQTGDYFARIYYAANSLNGSLTGGNDIAVVLTPVPEPAVLAVAFAALAAGGLILRRQSRGHVNTAAR